ncbi:glycosyltransferase [Rheinheimera baltica]|uniref:glycosyltransferase n=1 Tax=Rheinheimera baltica TaxID=67576 RepID=UPI00273F5D30|nr:glycosyltransferase [Rheinheimera baltica]MDP5149452.1 glycosyltransferase [Rheinheimera baltica]
MSAKVLIFTKRVLPRSNTFVAAQGNNLPSFEPVYIGLRNDSGGINLIEGKSTCVQANVEPFAMLSRLLLDGCQILTSKWANALAAQQANVIHAHFGKGGYYCAPIAKALNLPLITTFHGSDVTQKDKFSYNSKHRNITFKHSAKIIAVSKFIQNKLLARGCPEDKIIQHYIGIDNQFFSPAEDKFDQPTILFVGRLIEQKGCQYLLQAMKTIHKTLPDAQLIIAGYGSYQEKLQALASDINNVTFVGAQNRAQVKHLMSKAWVTCLPSIVMARGNEEGMPTVCVESQAVGTPVVAFDTGGVSEGVVHEKTGLLSTQKDVGQLAANLLAVLQSTAIRDQMSQAGIDHIDQHFNIRRQCEKLEAIYHSVSSGKR